ncbi:MAG: radical SAM protein, partial [Thermoplasmatales archaeon]|nr:radical SAM protein [Thermoplasmatales archaeon]
MKEIISWLNDSSYLSPLSPACKMCAQGSKMVVLATGLCPAKCFYCPLSFKKGGKDRIFADEWELDNEDDAKKLIREAEYINATGAGITGGDPLIVWKRVKKYISLLKDVFGSEFHIHLYTSGLKNADRIAELVSVGLDEVRFHPTPTYWDEMDSSPINNSIKNVLEMNVDVALEIPVMPGMENQIFSLVKWANNMGIKWINLNELEYSERNADNLNRRNYTVKDDVSAAVKGSQESAN